MSVMLQDVISANKAQMQRFEKHPLVELVRNPGISAGEKDRILGYLQPWSDTFQRVIALRVACESDIELQQLAQEHMAEELNHNTMLAKTRGGDADQTWDPVVSAASSWFVDQMLTGSGLERAVLAHLVLEGSGLVFLGAGCTAYPENEYFVLHSEADEEHLEMGYRLLEQRADEWQLDEVLQLLERGWQMITLLCGGVARASGGEPRADRWEPVLAAS